jgi:hypothetical protein
MAETRYIIDFIAWHLRLLYHSAIVGGLRSADTDGSNRRLRGQRGAVSLEQVLWFVAAGVSVAVIAGIIWTQIMSQASTPINAPSAP